MGGYLENKVMWAEKIKNMVTMYKTSHNALPGAVMKARVGRDRSEVVRLSRSVFILRDTF